SPTHAAALGIVIGVDGDNARHPRVATRGDDEGDCSADRDARERDVAQVELVKEAFDGLGEESRIVAGLRNVRIAVPWIVERIDGEVLGKLRHDLFEQIELCSERVQENENGTLAGVYIA